MLSTAAQAGISDPGQGKSDIVCAHTLVLGNGTAMPPAEEGPSQARHLLPPTTIIGFPVLRCRRWPMLPMQVAHALSVQTRLAAGCG